MGKKEYYPEYTVEIKELEEVEEVVNPGTGTLVVTKRNQIFNKSASNPALRNFCYHLTSSKSIMLAAHSGPIVVLNVTKLCSHAILVIKDNSAYLVMGSCSGALYEL